MPHRAAGASRDPAGAGLNPRVNSRCTAPSRRLLYMAHRTAWPNSRLRPVKDLVGQGGAWDDFDVRSARPEHNLLAGTARRARDPSGAPIPPGQQQTHAVLLVPVLTVTINTFIPHKNVDDPGNIYPFGNDYVFGGDNRMSGTPARATWNKNGSHRTQQRFNVIPLGNMGDADGLEDNAYNDSSPTGPKNSSVLNHVGTTRKYDKKSSLDSSGNLTPAALADTHKADGTLMVDEATASNSAMKVETEWLGYRKIIIKCKVSVGNPLTPAVFENEIDYEFEIIIDYTIAGAPTYSLSGKRNKFPAYEIYIGNKRIHEHDPLATGNGLMDLFGRGDPITPVVNAPLP